nr:hypothetical protein Iba_chr11cCG3380 [Ipomoea batatas]
MAGMEGIAAAGKVGRGILAGKGGIVSFGTDGKVEAKRGSLAKAGSHRALATAGETQGMCWRLREIV